MVKEFRKFFLKGKMTKFKRYAPYGQRTMWNKMAVKSFKQTNKDEFYIRTIKNRNKYEFFLRKK